MNAAPQPIEWRKARRSMGNGNCVEISLVASGIAVRDSKKPTGPMLAYTAESWREFTREARQGRFDASNAKDLSLDVRRTADIQ